MAFLRRILQAEPAVVISAVAAALALAVAFGVHLGTDQVEAIKNFVTALLAFAAAVAGVRQSVYAPDTVAELVAKAATKDRG